MPPCSSGTCLRSTRRCGRTTSSFISGKRSVPPASKRTVSPSMDRSASSSPVELAYSNARMHRLQEPPPRDWRLAHTYTNRIENSICDGRSGRDQRRFADPLGAGRVGLHVRYPVRRMLDGRNVGDGWYLVILQVRVEDDSIACIHHPLLQ